MRPGSCSLGRCEGVYSSFEAGVTILPPPPLPPTSSLHTESGICSSCFILLPRLPLSPLSRSENKRWGRKVATPPRHPARMWLEGMSGISVRGSQGSETGDRRGRLLAGRNVWKVRWARVRGGMTPSQGDQSRSPEERAEQMLPDRLFQAQHNTPRAARRCWGG